MVVKIEQNEYTLRLICGKFNELKEKIKSESLMDSIMGAIQNTDVDMMATIFSTVCLEPKVDKKQALEVIDQFLGEEKTVMDFGNLLLEVFDDSGFLPKRGMSKMIAEKTAQALNQIGAEMETESEMPFVGFKA